MKYYCLGYTHEKCKTCQREKNWNTLNQMPDALRKSVQSTMERISDDDCRLSNMGAYEAAHNIKDGL